MNNRGWKAFIMEFINEDKNEHDAMPLPPDTAHSLNLWTYIIQLKLPLHLDTP